MATSRLTPQEIHNLRDFAAQWGKIIVRRTYGEAGPPLETDLLTFEQIAQAAAQGLLQGILATLLQQQAQQLPNQVPCPDCQRLCLVKYEPRTVHCRGGTINYNEPFCHCSACRRAFFPLATDSEAGQPRLHS